MIQESACAIWRRKISFAQLGEVNQVNHMFYYYRTHCFQELHTSFQLFVPSNSVGKFFYSKNNSGKYYYNVHVSVYLVPSIRDRF